MVCDAFRVSRLLGGRRGTLATVKRAAQPVSTMSVYDCFRRLRDECVTCRVPFVVSAIKYNVGEARGDGRRMRSGERGEPSWRVVRVYVLSIVLSVPVRPGGEAASRARCIRAYTDYSTFGSWRIQPYTLFLAVGAADGVYGKG